METSKPGLRIGVLTIAAERLRQLEQEGFTDARDDQYTDAELVRAAICYAEAGSGFDLSVPKETSDGPPSMWPWDAGWWKPGTKPPDPDALFRCLAKAGALIAAEIDRLARDCGVPLARLEADESFTQSFDAKVWAEAFVKYVRTNPSIAVDEGTMLGWFANALMRGYDEAQTRNQAKLDEFQKSENELSEAYLRIRRLVDAFDTQPGGTDRFEITERKIQELKDLVENLRAERDVLNGSACSDEQKAGNGPCGACTLCLRSTIGKLQKALKIAREPLEVAASYADGGSDVPVGTTLHGRSCRDALQKINALTGNL